MSLDSRGENEQPGHAMRAVNGVQKTWTKAHLGEQKSDGAYWQAQPYQARLADTQLPCTAIHAYTKEVGVWIEPSPENAGRTVEALE